MVPVLYGMVWYGFKGSEYVVWVSDEHDAESPKLGPVSSIASLREEK